MRQLLQILKEKDSNIYEKILIMVNHDVAIYNSRKDMEQLLDEGFEVIISSPYGERIDDLIAMGCGYSKYQ